MKYEVNHYIDSSTARESGVYNSDPGVYFIVWNEEPAIYSNPGV